MELIIGYKIGKCRLYSTFESQAARQFYIPGKYENILPNKTLLKDLFVAAYVYCTGISIYYERYFFLK